MDCLSNCNFNSNDNETDILIMQLKKEVQKLLGDTTARLLTQDKKIAETCVYIKDNLSNELRILLDTLQNSGELDDIITSTVVSSINLLEDAVYPKGNLKRYGAAGNGLIDDTMPILKAIEDAKINNLPLIIDSGVYLITSDINAKGIKNINIKGEITTEKDNIFEVGGSSADGSGYNISIKKIKNLKVSGLKNSLLDIDFCEKLHLFADANDSTISSIAYTQFYGAYCKEILIEGINTTDSNLAWINENIFRIKRVDIVSLKGDYFHNNNRFEHINFERGILNLDGCRNNYFSARCEGGLTINSTNKASSNFVEKEYYFIHYFGDDTTEDENSTYSYYHVNMLQDERMLLQLDPNTSKRYPVNAMYYNENGSFTGKNFNEIFHTNLIKIDKTFSLKLKSDAKNFRVQMKFYDENMNQIKTMVDNFTDGRMSYMGNSSEWTYMISANVDTDSVVFFPGTAKYVEYNVIFGNAGIPANYVSIKLIKMINTDIHISNNVEMGIYTSVPTIGYFERGTILYGKSPAAGTSIGIVCVESGSPGIWKNWGAISE